MEQADIYYVDTRNADPRDHRVNVVRPGTSTPAIVMPAATTSRVGWAQPATIYPSTTTAYGQPMPYAQAPIYAQPPVYGQPPFLGTLGALFGGVNIGQVIDLIGQGFAALKSLPSAPTSTGDVGTDVANLTLYQRSLAEHAKLDEQIRTGVHIVAKLLGA
jgi:hypothetical protein